MSPFLFAQATGIFEHHRHDVDNLLSSFPNNVTQTLPIDRTNISQNVFGYLFKIYPRQLVFKIVVCPLVTYTELAFFDENSLWVDAEPAKSFTLTLINRCQINYLGS